MQSTTISALGYISNGPSGLNVAQSYYPRIPVIYPAVFDLSVIPGSGNDPSNFTSTWGWSVVNNRYEGPNNHRITLIGGTWVAGIVTGGVWLHTYPFSGNSANGVFLLTESGVAHYNNFKSQAEGIITVQCVAGGWE